ncbi:hypothetical protein [Aquimarina sp. Aq107]|uniref:hypothetical protein n=1 Tax=Aquimarina sp. Aq107 TaxID=1191912 RepID=UPI000D55AB79|nr:hypothetical protein [Aquimarina sp. Aq107]
MNFIDTLLWLENLDKEREFLVTENTSNKKGRFLIKKEAEGLCFKLGFPIDESFFQKDSKFSLTDNKVNLRINNFILKGILPETKFEGYIFESKNFDSEKKNYYRLLTRLNSWFYLDFLEKNKKEFKVVLNNIEFSISQKIFNSNSKSYLLIESFDILTLEEFKHITNSILWSVGFLKGHCIREEQIFFQSETLNWDQNVNFFSRLSLKSKILEKPITNTTGEYRDFIEDENFDFDTIDSKMSDKSLEKLISLLNANHNTFGAIVLLFESFNNSYTTRPSTLFIVLEILIEEISKVINPQKIKAINVRDNAIKTIEKYKSKIKLDDYNLLKKSINEIDKKLSQNNIKIESVFKSLQVTLSVEERVIIGKRNKFFHGKLINDLLTIKNEEDYTKIEKEYQYLTYRLYTMISKLILKFIGFEGYIINHSKLREKHYEKNLDEDYFIKI